MMAFNDFFDCCFRKSDAVSLLDYYSGVLGTVESCYLD